VDKYLKGWGVEQYWKLLGTLEPKQIYERFLAALHSAKPLHGVVAKMAAFAACIFIGLHEAVHAYGGHIAYRSAAINSLPSFDDESSAGILRDALELFEFVADTAALTPLFGLMASHCEEFKTFVKLSSGGDAGEGLSDLYCPTLV
jgi:hypothetical protein